MSCAQNCNKFNKIKHKWPTTTNNYNATMTKLKEQKKPQYHCKEGILCDGMKHVKLICIR
jgi:hypothetical protein